MGVHFVQIELNKSPPNISSINLRHFNGIDFHYNKRFTSTNGRKITEGNLANINDYPFFVWLKASFYRVGEKSIKRQMCGGSQISKIWILTAAHCIVSLINNHTYFAYHVKVAWNVRDREEEDKWNKKIYADENRMFSKDFRIPNEYLSERKKSDDIALIRLPMPKYVGKNIGLPVRDDDGDYRQENTKITIIGFGNTLTLPWEYQNEMKLAKHLQKMTTFISSSVKCFLDAYTKLKLKNKVDPRKVFCYGERLNEPRASSGDSGSPVLARREDGTILQIGIVVLERYGILNYKAMGYKSGNQIAVDILTHFEFITNHTGIQRKQKQHVIQ